MINPVKSFLTHILFCLYLLWFELIPGNILSRAFCKFGWNTRVHVSLYELILCKKVAHDRDPVNNITHVSCLKVLGVTLQSNHRFSEHTKVKLKEANRCLYVIRCLRKEGYHQPDVVYVYRSIILPQLTYGLPLYASSTPELTTVQNFLQRCFKRKYVLYQIGIMMCWRGRSLTFQEDLQYAWPSFVPFGPQNEREFSMPRNS